MCHDPEAHNINLEHSGKVRSCLHISISSTQDHLNTVTNVCIWAVVHNTFQSLIYAVITIMDFCDLW